MTDHQDSPQQPFDREIDVRGIVKTGAWLAAVTIAAFLVAWGYYRLLAKDERRQDPKPTPIALTMPPPSRPGPQLQASPESELAAFKQSEVQRLESWGWMDETAGLAHVPIERAMEAVAEAGSLPDFTPAPPSQGAP